MIQIMLLTIVIITIINNNNNNNNNKKTIIWILEFASVYVKRLNNINIRLDTANKSNKLFLSLT